MVLAATAMVFAIDRTDAAEQRYWSDVDNTAIFAVALTASGLRPAVGRDEAFTLFLPSDDALEREGSAALLRGVYLTPGNRARLADLLAYHIVPGRKIPLVSETPAEVTTMSGDALSIDQDGERIPRKQVARIGQVLGCIVGSSAPQTDDRFAVEEDVGHRHAGIDRPARVAAKVENKTDQAAIGRLDQTSQ